MTEAATAHWYPIHAMRRVNAPVRVRWAWWEGMAVLFRSAPGAEPRWVEPTRAGMIDLPRRRQTVWHDTALGEDVTVSDQWLLFRGWGPSPSHFQPVGPWPDPLPDPVRLIAQARYVSINRTRFDATEAAAEMEADRETARARRRREDDEDAASLPWWRDATQISYGPPGAITPHEAEGRVMRALYFMAGEFEARMGLGPRQTGDSWDALDDLQRAAAIARGEAVAANRLPHLLEAPGDTSDRLLTAMRWVCELRLAGGADAEWTFVVLDARARNQPWTFTQISELPGIKRSRSAVHDLYKRGIARITAIANAGTPVTDAALTELQHRNRHYANAR